MASISDTIVNQAFDTTTGQKGMDSVTQLVGQIQNTQVKRQALEQQKASVQQAKIESLAGHYKTYAGMPSGPGKQAFGKSFIPNYIKATGLESIAHPNTLEMFQKDSQIAGFIVNEIEAGNMKMEDLKRPDLVAKRVAEGLNQHIAANEIAGVSSTFSKDFVGAGRTKRAADVGLEKSRIVATGQNTRNESQIQGRIDAATKKRETSGEVAVRTAVGKAYAEYKLDGGKSGMASALRLLDKAAKALDEGSVETGGITTKIPLLNSDIGQSVINAKMLEVRTQAQGALNTVLRTTLGSAFTKEEGERVLNQVWDDKLSNAVNARKVKAKIKELRENVAEKEAQFVKFGHMGEGGGIGPPASARGKMDTVANNVKAALQADPNMGDQEILQRLQQKFSPEQAAEILKKARGN